MKRIIVLFIIISLGVAFIGCNSKEKNFPIDEIDSETNEGNSQITKTNTETNETKTQLEKIDKETNEDIKNITTLLQESSGFRMTFTMDNKIRGTQHNGTSFYMCEINDKQYDIICAYIDEKDYDCDIFSDDYYSKLTWYKCSSKTPIMKNMDGQKLTVLFIVFDVFVSYDIINDKECNYKFKYYKMMNKKIHENANELYINLDNFKLDYINLIIWKSKDFIESKNYYSYHSHFLKDYDLDLGYEIRSNSEGMKRVVFNNASIVINGIVENHIDHRFGESYQYFSELLTDEEDFEKIVYSEYYIIRKKVSINIEEFIKLVKEINLKD